MDNALANPKVIKTMNASGDDDTGTLDYEDRLGLLKSRLTIAKKWAKKPHKAWKAWMAEYNIQDWDDTSTVREKVRIGYLFRKTESDLPSLFDDQPDVFIKGRNANASLVQPLVLGLYDYLWDKQKLDLKIEDVATYFLVLGMGFLSSPWVTKTKKIDQPVQAPMTDPQTGQPVLDPTTGQPQMQTVMKEMEVPIIDNPDATVEDPFKLYFSPETKFGLTLPYERCPYYFKEMTMTQDEIMAKFGVQVEPTETLQIDDLPYDEDKVKPDQEPELAKDDMKRATVYEYYGCLPEEFAQDLKDDEGNLIEWTYDHDYHIFFTMNEELQAEDNPYDIKPLMVLGNYGFANRFWKFGDSKHLMPLIQELEFYRSQILKHTRKMANPKLLIPDTTVTDEQAIMDPRSGRPVKFSGATPPSYLQPGVLGREVAEGIELVRTDLEKQSGSFDLTNGNPQSTVKTPKGIEVYSNAADKNVERKRKKIARFIRELIIFQFQQVAENWKPDEGKILAIVDGGQPQEVNVDQKVLNVIGGINEMYNLDIEVESLSVNRAMQKQDALDLFTLGVQHRDIFNVDELAKDLLQNGYGKKDADRYLLTQEQKAALAQNAGPQPQVSVRLMIDGQSPTGAKILENEGLLNAQDAVEAVAPTNPALAGPNHPVNQPPQQPAPLDNTQRYIQEVTGG